MTARLAAVAAGVIACAIVGAGDTPIDRSLPFLAALVAILSFAAPRFESVVLLGLPLLVVTAISVADDRARLLVYGVILLFAAIVSFGGMLNGGTVESWRAVAFVLTVAAALRAIPTTLDGLLPLALLLVGEAALVLALANGRLAAHSVPIVLAVALITPLHPIRAATFPLLLAALIVAIRSRAPAWIIGTAVVAVAAGRWAVLLAAIAVVPALAQRWITSRRGLRFIAPPLNATGVPLGRTVAFAPGFAWDLATAPTGQRIAAVLLCALALFLRPALSALFVIAAVVLVLTATATPLRRALSIPSAIFVSLWILLFAWSGALIPFFPLPVWFQRAEDRPSQSVGFALAPGESAIVQPVRAAGVTVVAFGSNVSGLRAGTPIGRLDYVDQKGRGYRRDLAIGEVIDWGAFRQEHFFAARNPVPLTAEEPIEGFGAAAFVPAFSRIDLGPQPVTSLRITAASSLPPAARLELHRLEFTR